MNALVGSFCENCRRATSEWRISGKVILSESLVSHSHLQCSFASRFDKCQEARAKTCCSRDRARFWAVERDCRHSTKKPEAKRARKAAHRCTFTTQLLQNVQNTLSMQCRHNQIEPQKGRNQSKNRALLPSLSMTM